jgi:hypothetical protein
MKYVTHDDMTPRETIHDDEIEVVYGCWEIPENSTIRGVSMLRIGPHGFIHNLAARCWLIEIDAFIDGPSMAPEMCMAHTRIDACNDIIAHLAHNDHPFAREVLRIAVYELEEYTTLIMEKLL